MSNLFFVWFGVCFSCYMLRTLFTILNSKQNQFVQHKGILTAVYIIMFVLWFSWAQMCFVEPETMALPLAIRIIGLVLFASGVFLFIFSHAKLKGFKDKNYLVKKGIYSKIRNPMYLGFIIWIIGFPVFLQKLWSLATFPIWISHILIWKALEEKELEKKYPGYSVYKKKTWF